VKKKILLAVGLLFAICLIPGIAFAADEDWSTCTECSAEHPHEIYTVADLNKIRTHVKVGEDKYEYIDGYFKIMNDITFTDSDYYKEGDIIYGWLPIGKPDVGLSVGNWGSIAKGNEAYDYFRYFKGTIDGDNHVIKNFKIQNQAYGCGLVSLTHADSVIKNLHFENYDMNGNCVGDGDRNKARTQASRFSGGLVAHAYGTIENCSIKDSKLYSVKGWFGGIVGQLDIGGKIKDCSLTNSVVETFSITGEIKSNDGDKAGGIAGVTYGSTIENCCVDKCTIHGKSNSTGGIVADCGPGGEQNTYTGVGVLIKDCVVKNTSITDDAAGAAGIAGSKVPARSVADLRIINCTVDKCKISGNIVAGLISLQGGNIDGKYEIENCIVKDTDFFCQNGYNKDKWERYNGGLVGFAYSTSGYDNRDDAYIKNCLVIGGTFTVNNSETGCAKVNGIVGALSRTNYKSLENIKPFVVENVKAYISWDVGSAYLKETYAPEVSNAVAPIFSDSYTFMLRGGTVPADSSAIKNNIIIPTKDGCVFAGWYRDSALTEPVGETFSSSDAGKTFYAKWVCNDESMHEWDSQWTVDNPASETETGAQHKHCSKCDSVWSQTIPKIVDSHEHQFGTGVITKEPTCTDEGIKTYTCINASCEEPALTYTESIPATGHHLEKSKEYLCAVCSEEGYVVYKCRDCGVSYSKSVKSNHKWSNIIEERCLKTAATEASPAVYYQSCSVCGEIGEQTFEVGSILFNKSAEFIKGALAGAGVTGTLGIITNVAIKAALSNRIFERIRRMFG